MVFPYIDIAATGKNIRRLRTERGISVIDVSKQLMIDKQAVYRWEYGKTLPQLDNCLALARLFQVSMEDILVEKGEALASPYPLCVMQIGRQIGPPVCSRAGEKAYPVSALRKCICFL